VAEIINLPEDHKIVGLLPLGYPDLPKNDRNLKPKEEVIVWDSF
jgi:nitroreductase